MALAATLLFASGCAARATPVQPVPAHPVPQTQTIIDNVSRLWFEREWRAYADRFVMADGRVVDNGNGNITHSEGQGYGLLLAAKAGDRDRFERIWQWTRTHLMIRKDGLAAWKWTPESNVADTNNATDGDMLIAWALSTGAKQFERPDYRKAAEYLAQAIGARTIVQAKGGPVLLPGTSGFSAKDRADGPVINLSYWIFPAFPALQELAPDVDWARLRRNGLALISASRFGTFGLPTDWESLGGSGLAPAAGFPSGFGYNAIRIPLYLAMDGADDSRQALRRFAGSWSETASPGTLLDSKQASVTVPIAQTGYAIILAIARCMSAGKVIAPELISQRSDLYFPETLRLLSVIAIQKWCPTCL